VVAPLGRAEVDGPRYVGVDHPGPELGLAEEALDRNGVLGQPWPEHLEGHHAPFRMLGTIDLRSATLTNGALEGVTGNSPTYKRILSHGSSQRYRPDGRRGKAKRPPRIGGILGDANSCHSCRTPVVGNRRGRQRLYLVAAGGESGRCQPRGRATPALQ